jgi:bifunctional DNA-binding transcriptional regulator/antitoxin component of YhaV-PrlF toxin-antitoxin module
MTAHFAKLTAEAQAILPKAVQDALGVKPGDDIVYQISEGRVLIAKAEPLDMEYLRGLEATLSEWNSPEDAAAYDDL